MLSKSFSWQFIQARILSFQFICLRSFKAPTYKIYALLNIFLPLPSPKIRKMGCTHDFTFPQFKLRNGVPAADSRSIAVRGADVDQAVLYLIHKCSSHLPNARTILERREMHIRESMNQVLGWQLSGVSLAIYWAQLLQQLKEGIDPHKQWGPAFPLISLEMSDG